MAQNKVSVKLLIDTSTNKVLFAEGSKDFVDFLFHIFSLPVGAVVRLLTKEAMVGSLGNLYDSVENLSSDYIQSSLHKDSLLRPSCNTTSIGAVPLLSIAQAPATSCPKQPAKRFFGCSQNSPYIDHLYVTDRTQKLCPCCKCQMSQELKYVGPSGVMDENLPNFDGYVKGVVTYMIMDDLVVKPMSTISSITLLNHFKINDVASLQEKVVYLGLNEAVALLKTSLESKTVLTDVFLPKKVSDRSPQRKGK